MTKTEQSRFKAIPNFRIIEVEQLIRHRDGIRVERSADHLEEIRQASERALAVCSLDRYYSHLRNVLAALRRTQEGSFGICQQCDDEIAPKRLVAVPWAQFYIRRREAVDRSLERDSSAKWRPARASRLSDHEATAVEVS
jgi:RNA polymerase-binding transcription factor DksA